MRYFIGWCHDSDTGWAPSACKMGPLVTHMGIHWHYWNGTDMTSGVVDATKFKTYGEAEDVLAEILLLHPERWGSMTIETWRNALDRGRV